MRIYKISNNKMEKTLEEISDELESKYVGLDLHVYETESKVQVQSLRLPLEMRRQGIGSEILEIIKDFAQKIGKPVTLSPQAERGYKKKLEDFYKEHGFKWNKGRNRDYAISDPFGASMYWKPNKPNK